MKVFVVSKNTLVYCGIAVLAVIAAIVVAALSGGKANEPNGESDAVRITPLPVSAVGASAVEEYELEVLAGLMKELPVYSVSRDDKRIALTIDAAWEDDKTPFILETLDKYGIKATFFLCGFWVNDYPDMVKAISDAGHEIGNHSMTHPHMNKLSSTQIRDELSAFESLINGVIGRGTKLFRVPYGEYNDTVIKTLRESGYEVVQWNIDTVDWKPERSAQTILDSVLGKLKDGSIILSHNNGYKIEQYLPALIEAAKAQGYEFVTVSELLLEGSTLIDVNGVQKSAS
ncbi:MAG: polysaccharide deacetylase family protein [Clostridia bacterium]|nr:polysaccharide deacetylase family protein [Clostridia bacterium]